MIYIKTVTFPDGDEEFDFLFREKRTCYDSLYPFKILSRNRFERIDFKPITILYGGNGSGKSTALNVIAEKAKITRDSNFNKSSFYPDYLNYCDLITDGQIPENSRIITSDDVFDYMLDVRNINDGIDRKRDEIQAEYLEEKYSGFRMRSIEDYEQLKKVNDAKRKSQSKVVRERLINNIREYSNGESAFHYFAEKIGEKGLYILDEPENSLSPQRQEELVRFIEDSTRFFGCQFIISTHSPFMLAMRGAKIYDLDENPVDVKKWTELKNVRVYFDFFKKHSGQFLSDEENRL
ncbi:MAG: AAA family ATPase [Lachnospiraceae bacterium]